jgi:rhodanese-related sulfurtransferase
MNSRAKQEFKTRLFGEFARIGKAFSSPHRLQLIEILAQGERSVDQLSEEMALPVPNVSQHLQVLRSAQLVSVRKDGLYSHYRLADANVFRVWQAIRELGKARLSEIDRIAAQYLKGREGMEALGATELRRRLDAHDVVVLDVRPQMEYEAGHIAGARSIPIEELNRRLSELPKSREIVAYCRGPYCVFADEAVALLRARGLRARRLTEGFPDWKSRGWPVEAGIANRTGGRE